MDTAPHVFDGHNDTLLDLHLQERGEGRSFFQETEVGHIDLPRAQASNYAGGFFSIFVPNDGSPELHRTADGYEIPLADAIPHTHARTFTYEVLARLYRLQQQADGVFRVVTSIDELDACLGSMSVGAIPHLEGAAAVAPDLSNLDFLYVAGVRSIGVTWSRPNEFGTGAPFAFPRHPDTGPGLTDAGEALVEGCNERGILIDLAHLNAKGFRDVAKISADPLVVSHSAVHALCQSTRNLTDKQLDAIGASNGVVGIAFCTENLHPDGEQDTGLPMDTIVDHIEYVVERIGIDHVAIGSDFDGTTVPDVIGDVTGLSKVFDALAGRGFDARERAKIARENWVRVLKDTW